jgi:ubiquinone/menaquinone biosynthesis C-methylase UbiE
LTTDELPTNNRLLCGSQLWTGLNSARLGANCNAVTRCYEQLAAAYVRGTMPDEASGRSDAELFALGSRAGLKLHRFKHTMELPRVRAALGVLRALNPRRLLDIGTGRGVFLWPLLDAFPDLDVTAVEPDEHRRKHLEAVCRGGIDRLHVVGTDACKLPFENGAFDVVTALEVLEHQIDPAPLAREAMRLASHFVIVSVPSKPDENPEHVHLFTGATLETLLRQAGAVKVQTDYVFNHIIAVARPDRS